MCWAKNGKYLLSPNVLFIILCLAERFFKQTGKCLVKLDELHDNIASYDVFYYFVSSMQQDQSKFINVYFLIYYVLANTISR